VQITDTTGRILVAKAGAEPPAADSDIATYTAAVVRTGVDISDFTAEAAAADDDAGTAPVLGHVTIRLSTTSLLQSLKQSLLTGILLTVTGLLASILLAYLVARGISGPIRHLTAVVGKLTGGNLAARAREGSPGELGSLESGINQMADSLQDAQNKLAREIEDATAALRLTVTELETRNIELDQAREEAVRAAAAKSDFLARMSHEIRTPLSAIIGFNDLLGKTRLSENQQEYCRTMQQAASQLLLVIEDILGYTRLEAGKVKLEPARFNLYDCLENVISMLGATAHEKELELVLYIHSDVPRFIVSDQNRVSQVLTNLAANAIKFTDQGHVVVEVSAPGPVTETVTIRISITDTGIGMTDSQLGQVFSPFVQADASTSRRYGGTGLGLAISKKLAEQLGGEIRVTSQPGAGSVFSFTLTSPRLEEAGSQPAKILAGKTVIVYDRNPFALRAARNRLFTWGATVFNTADPDRLQQMLIGQERDTACDLLVMGLSWGEFGGHSCNDMCRQYRTDTTVPTLFLVAAELGDPAPDRDCSTDCRIISKPARSDLMLRTIRDLLKLPDGAASITPARRDRTDTAPLAAGLDVLVVEDNRFNRDLLSRMLTDLGVNATLASDGREACTLAGSHRYDIIFMDIHMPVMGGVEAAQHMRQGSNRQTPIVALTADVFTGQQHDLAAAGIDDCLHKPVAEHQLIEMLQKWARPGAQAAPARNANVPAPAVPAADTAPDGFSLPPEFRQRLQQELDVRLQALRLACSTGDDPAMQDELHQLKGIVDYFQLEDFHFAFRTLQTALLSRHAPTIEAAIDALQRLLADNTSR
ncbi:MAG: ATP-binding protein, partial [Gammaproteobacteria bacterium]|jgi:two-component system sensor histidine kinase BarA